MKKMRKLIPAFAMLMVAAIMMSTASFAWFSMGTKATATGMQVQATASSSLVIDSIASNLASADQAVELTAYTTGLKPATRLDTSANKLGRPNDEQGINAGTGAMNSGNELVAAGDGYYYDYTVYIATTGGAALENKNLTASITVPATLANYIHNATTIDFWTTTYTDGAAGTMTFCGDAATKNFNTIVTTGTATGSTAAPTKTLKVTLATGVTIPLLMENESDAEFSYIAVTMRVYFDGELKDGDNCYIRNTMASTVGAGFSVEFAAE